MSQPETSRRSFLDFFLKGGLFIWMTSMVVPILAYVWPARGRGVRTPSVSAGNTKDFSIGSGRMVQLEGKPVLVVRKSEADFVALSAICTHLGCIVKWSPDAQQILCPCHAAVFSIEGQVLGGPPPRPLDQYQAFVAGGEVMVKL